MMMINHLWNHLWNSSLRIFNTPQAGFELVQNLSSGFGE